MSAFLSGNDSEILIRNAYPFGPDDEIGCHGVSDVLFDCVAHRAGAEAGVETFQDEEFENFIAPGEAFSATSQEFEFAVEMQICDFKLHVVVQAIENEFLGD